jgi:hypothetical protein
MTTRQTVMSIYGNSCAAHADVLTNDWSTETQADSDANRGVVHFQADSGQRQRIEPITRAWGTRREKASSINE